MLPTLTGLTTPEVLIVAAAVFEEVQVPPAVASVRVMVEPLHTVPGPAIAAVTGSAFTVIAFEPEPEQSPLVTV